MKPSEVANFGHIAAEDDDIKRFFVQTPVYDALLRGEKQIVVGRKGSGKTHCCPTNGTSKA